MAQLSNQIDMYDVDGNYIGAGGPGVVTQPGVDPTGGGHAKVVSEGVAKMEGDAASMQNGVVQTLPVPVGWNGWKPVESSNGGQSVDGSTAPAEKKVVISRREDRKPAYSTKAMLDATETKRNIGELPPEQIDAVRNSDAQPRPLSQAEINAETQDIVDSINKEKAEKQQNPKEWSGTRDEAIEAMRQFNGNVDLYNRPVIDAYELTKKGWDKAPKKPGESTATVFSSQYGIKDANGKVREILVTPILQNGTVLSPKELEDYIGSLEGKDILKSDDKSLVIAIDVPADGSSGQNLHKMQEAYGGPDKNGLTPSDLQKEQKLNPASSNTGASVTGATSENANGTDGAGKTVVAENGGQSEVPKTEEAKTEVSVNTAKPDVSEADYQAALKRIKDDVAKGGIGTEEDKLIVFDYEHPHKPIPEMPKLDEFVPSAPPALKSIDSSYRTAYAIMQERMKAAGDDPASKAKRAKARRAEKLVAALGDLLQVAANMWGVARGANSAKLSSISAGVSKRHATEDALALKREAQYAKDLESAIKRDESLTKEENKRAMELWKAAENSRKYNVGEKNKALMAEYVKKLQQWTNDEAQRGRDRHQVQVQHDRQVNYLNNHRYRSSEISQRTAGSLAVAIERGKQSRATKQTASYRDLHKDDDE